jgi:Peptidase C13 family
MYRTAPTGSSMACPARSARIVVFIGVSVTAALYGWASNSVTAQPVERAAISNGQPELLARTLAPLKATSANQRQIYFVGFAGYGRQAVFKREVLAVRQLFDDRFGTKERSVALVNHPSTVKEIPLASVGNLDGVLQHVGKLMDARRDTLFLFLSSHGERGIVAVEMPGLALTQVRPEHLKRMLDRSGIKRRVVVVSSCHSGSFIPALADPNTLVITASRADRNSFGCEDRRQWTYFGDAYFNQALRQDASFRRAFDRARELIAAWEAQERLTPSLPQIAGGEALRDLD